VLAVIRDKGFNKIDRNIYRLGLLALVAAAVGVFAFGSHAFRIPLACLPCGAVAADPRRPADRPARC
jgi:hypothetical protein